MEIMTMMRRSSSHATAPPPPPPTSDLHGVTLLPPDAVHAICRSLVASKAARAAFYLATLFRLPLLQAETYRGLRRFEFDAATRVGSTELLDLLLRYCRATGARPRYVNANVISDAARRGRLPVVHWWGASGLPLCNLDPTSIVHAACEGGHVDILRWCLDVAEYPRSAFYSTCVYVASRGGHTYVLDWWRDNGFELEDGDPMDAASDAGRINVLEWWRSRSGLRDLKYSSSAMETASAKGRVAVLQWWKDSGLELRYDGKAMLRASENGQIAALEWWRDSGLEIVFAPEDECAAMDAASGEGRLSILDFWRSSGLPVKCSERAVDKASERGFVEVLQWWKASGLELKYSAAAINRTTHLAVLQWWKDSSFELKYSCDAMDRASMFGNLELLQWWLESGLELKYSSLSMELAQSEEIRLWWKECGLPIAFTDAHTDLSGLKGKVTRVQQSSNGFEIWFIPREGGSSELLKTSDVLEKSVNPIGGK
ncbi:hypothetical protein DFJ73DRAFT_906852 [Zopfochytrium polystomum]|nr:hypothetical protein DFJ73DRAFT_906852 [Zopfochytrium polystomum]